MGFQGLLVHAHIGPWGIPGRRSHGEITRAGIEAAAITATILVDNRLCVKVVIDGVDRRLSVIARGFIVPLGKILREAGTGEKAAERRQE